jgi:membrane associated rhomboid family serine protease
MPNIRTLGDASANRPAAASAANRASLSDIEGDAPDMQLFGAGRPMDGSPLPSVGDLLCPRFKWSLRSFIFVITCIDILVFVATLIVGQAVYGQAFDLNNKMLGPGGETFVLLGAKVTQLIKQGEVHRLIVPVFLHAGVIHLLFNMFFQCNIGFRMEEIWGIPRIMTIYFAAGIGGNLLSALASPRSISVGASGALFGLLGGMIAFLIVNWNTVPGACMVILVL